MAGAISKTVRENDTVDIQAIGPSAVNQAIKAIALARSYLEEELLDLYTQPAFKKIEIKGEERTAIIFMITSQPVIQNIPVVLSDKSTAKMSMANGH